MASLHGAQYVAQKSNMTALPFMSEIFCTLSPESVQLISAKGLVGAIGRLVVGRSLIEIGLLPTATGAAAGRHPIEIKIPSNNIKFRINSIVECSNRKFKERTCLMVQEQGLSFGILQGNLVTVEPNATNHAKCYKLRQLIQITPSATNYAKWYFQPAGNTLACCGADQTLTSDFDLRPGSLKT